MSDCDQTNPPEIAISRASSPDVGVRQYSTLPLLSAPNVDESNGRQKRRPLEQDVGWHIRWTRDRFPNGRVLVVDYISNQTSKRPEKRHVAVAAQEFENLESLQAFYANNERVHAAALRVVHVQNATWSTQFLLDKYNIDHKSEIVGMRGFSKWAKYEKPRQRNGKPFANGRSWREQNDPWRNISRTAFGLDYVKVFRTQAPRQRNRHGVFGEKPIDAKMMHLDAYEDSHSPHGYDASVQRISVYVQRSLGPAGQVSPELDPKSPYAKPDGEEPDGDGNDKVGLGELDNSSAVIVFETSASMLKEDCLVQPRNDIENRWRRLSFYLRKDDVMHDARLASQCTNMILSDVFHGLAIIWQEFLGIGVDVSTIMSHPTPFHRLNSVQARLNTRREDLRKSR